MDDEDKTSSAFAPVNTDGYTYAFTDWSTDDATVEDGEFKMPAKDVTLTGTWTSEKVPTPTHSVTVKYVGEDGRELCVSKEVTDVPESSSWDVEEYIVEREGYEPPAVPTNVKGTMEQKDIVVTVVYTKKATTPTPTPTTTPSSYLPHAERSPYAGHPLPTTWVDIPPNRQRVAPQGGAAGRGVPPYE